MTPRPPVRVLVIDDVEDLRRVVRVTLERDGAFEVVGEAADGDAGVEAAQRLQPDVVLLDLDMPGRSGLDVLPAVRAAAPGAQVVILSGLLRASVERRALEAGAVGYLEKGIPARRLVDELVAVVGLVETVDAVLAEHRATLADDTTAPRAARRLVHEAMERWDCEDRLGTVALLTTELVTNAVVHARSVPEVSVVLQRDRIRVDVADQSREMPAPRTAEPGDTSGRGLQLLADLSSAWGVEARPDGKVVWFEVPRLDATDGGTVIR